MANHDHADNIGTHPAYSKDPETALRARLDAATRQKAHADAEYQRHRDNLRVFLAARDRIAAEMPDEYPTDYADHLAVLHQADYEKGLL